MRQPVQTRALVAAAFVVAAVVSGCGAGGNTTTTAHSSARAQPPTLAQFAAEPACNFYNSASSIRMRIRAANVNFVCRLLARRFPVSRASWTTAPHHFRTSGGNRRYATVCRLARSQGKVWAEAEINAPTGRFTLGHFVCANLVGKGWIDLGGRLTAYDVLGLQGAADRDHELVRVYFCNAVATCSPSATRGEERLAQARLQREPCVKQVVFVSKALAEWWVQKKEGIPPLHLGANPLPDALVVVAKKPSCAPRIAAAARADHLAGVQTVRAHT